MKNSRLDAILKRAHPPDLPEEYWDELPTRIGSRLGEPLPRERRRPRLVLRLVWGAAAAIAGVAAALMILPLHGNTERNVSVLESAKVIHEMMSLFPNRVRAVVQDQHGLHLLLSETNDVPDSTPLFVQVKDGNRVSSLVTFSGQEVRIDGRQLTVLSDAQGGVILVGDRFLWSSREPGRAAGKLRIESKELSRPAAG